MSVFIPIAKDIWDFYLKKIKLLQEQFLTKYDYVKVDGDIYLGLSGLNNPIPSGIIFYANDYTDALGNTRKAGTIEAGIPGKFNETTCLRQKIHLTKKFTEIFNLTDNKNYNYIPTFTDTEVKDILYYTSVIINRGSSLKDTGIILNTELKIIEYFIKNKMYMELIITHFVKNIQKGMTTTNDQFNALPDEIMEYIKSYIAITTKNIITHPSKYNTDIAEILSNTNKIYQTIDTFIDKNYSNKIKYLTGEEFKNLLSVYFYIKNVENSLDQKSKDWFIDATNKLIEFVALNIRKENGILLINDKSINSFKNEELASIGNFFNSIRYSDIKHQELIENFTEAYNSLLKTRITLQTKSSTLISKLKANNPDMLTAFTKDFRALLKQDGLNENLANRYIEEDLPADERITISFEKLNETENEYNAYIHDPKTDTIHKIFIDISTHPEAIKYIKAHETLLHGLLT